MHFTPTSHVNSHFENRENKKVRKLNFFNATNQPHSSNKMTSHFTSVHRNLKLGSSMLQLYIASGIYSAIVLKESTLQTASGEVRLGKSFTSKEDSSHLQWRQDVPGFLSYQDCNNHCLWIKKLSTFQARKIIQSLRTSRRYGLRPTSYLQHSQWYITFIGLIGSLTYLGFTIGCWEW